MRSWIAGAAIALTLGTPLSSRAQACDPGALLGACAASPANATFLDLVGDPAAARDRDESLSSFLPASRGLSARPVAAVAQPAVYTGTAAPVLSPAIDTPLQGSDDPVPGWLAHPALALGPAPDFAWVLALGFLGLIVLRRTRAARSY